MPTNQRLVPTPIVDRNGKPTTVHRKPQQPASGAILPAPSPAAVEDAREALMGRVANLIASLLRTDDDVDGDDGLIDLNDGELSPHEVNRMLELHEPEFLYSMEKRMKKSGPDAFGIAEQLAYGESQQSIRETIHFYDQLSDVSYKRTSAQVASLRLYQIAPFNNDLTYGDEQSQRTLLAVVEVSAAIERVFGDPFSDQNHPLQPHHASVTGEPVARMDNALIQLIRERPEDSDHMADIITKHKTADPQTIRGVLNGFIPTLADGSL